MSLVRSYQPRGGQFHRHGRPFYGRNKHTSTRATAADYNCNYDNYAHNTKLDKVNHDSYNDFSQNFQPSNCYNAYSNAYLVSNSSTVVRCEDVSAYDLTNSKRDRSTFEDDEVVLMSRDEIERCSPSRKDGIDLLQEAHLRYSYCVFLQNLGIRLNLPQTTIGTAMVLCHRFFVRRSHASHDRFDWLERYRERITDAEQLILTTLNFELNVQHPYESLTSTLQKLGFSQSLLVNLALNLVSEGFDLVGIVSPYVVCMVNHLQSPVFIKLRSSLWLQFKPHQIAAGAAYLAAKFLNMNLASCHNVWHEFHTPPSVLKDVAHQLMELF
ncbi:UNVERIFIED_CONTAM: Cyclin-T1-5 [Sesamum calycinum]|uniref:Cyclin-T1-5 n=1 Tax=Sesamum calycinum TaxID=2727403 RepID=A0AAW2R8V7_9LAMI